MVAVQTNHSVQDDPGLPGLGALRRHLWTLIVGFVVGVAGAWYYCQHATVQYQSAAQVLVMQRDANPPDEQSTAATGTVDERVAKDLLGTHIQIIRSRKVLERALERGQLASLPSFQPALEEDQTPIEYLLENLRVAWGGEGQAQTAQVLNVAFLHTSAPDAAVILQAIIDSYQDFVREKFQDAGSQAAELIAKARDELAVDVAKKEGAYRTFRENTPRLLGDEESVNIHQARLKELETLLADQQVHQAQLEARAAIVAGATEGEGSAALSDLEKLASIGDDDIGRLSFLVSIERGDPVSEASRDLERARYDQLLALHLEAAKQLLALRLEARKLETQFGPDNPGYLATREAIRELEGFVDAQDRATLQGPDSAGEVRPAELMNAYRGLLRNDLTETERHREELQRQSQDELEHIKELVAAQMTGDSMRRDMERAQVLYDGVVQRLQELNLIKDYRSLLTEVISPVEAGEQVWPKLLILLAAGGFVGLLLGSAVAVLLDVRVPRFHDSEDIQRIMRLNVLTHIPDLARRRLFGKADDPFLMMLREPRSPAAESFRRLRTALCFGGRPPSKIVQVTSPTRGDGTTALVTNLAVSMAQTGMRVLILDANLRDAKIHEVFGVDPEVGLASYLSGAAELSELVKPTTCDNLSVIPRGPATENPSELLAGRRFDELIRRVREDFDLVLIDSPALLESSDAQVVAARVDGVLLQVRATRSGRTAALGARSRLDEQGVQVLGIASRRPGRNGARITGR